MLETLLVLTVGHDVLLGHLVVHLLWHLVMLIKLVLLLNLLDLHMIQLLTIVILKTLVIIHHLRSLLIHKVVGVEPLHRWLVHVSMSHLLLLHLVSGASMHLNACLLLNGHYLLSLI